MVMEKFGTITDLHTECINRLKALYVPNTTVGHNLKSRGYDGYIDPHYESTNVDFVAIGDSGDVQQFQLVGTNDGIGSLEEDITDFAQKEIPISEVETFFQQEQIAISPTAQEKALLLPSDIYNSYQDEIDQIANENNLILWIVEVSQKSTIWKEVGNHSQDNLNKVLEPAKQGPIQLRHVNCDFCTVAKGSSEEVTLFRFAERLITYSYNQQKESVSLHVLDDIMVDQTRGVNILGHLPPDQRREIWNRCMWHMRHRFELMSESSDKLHEFEWRNSRFLRYASDRSKMLDKVRNELGVGTEA